MTDKTELAIKEIQEEARLHNISDKSFQDAQLIHNLDMHKLQKEMKDLIEVMGGKLDDQISASKSALKFYQEASYLTQVAIWIFVAIAAVATFVATIAGGIAGWKYLVSLFTPIK